MSAAYVFRWRDGRGWLVFSSEGDTRSTVRDQALARSAADGAAACIVLDADPDAADRLLEDIVDLGAPSAYLIDVAVDDDATLQSRLGEAGVIIVAGNATPAQMRSALIGAALDAIGTAFDHGAVVLLEGSAAIAFGAWLVGRGGISAGIGWVENGVVYLDADEVALLAKPLFDAHPEAVAIGIGARSALVFGPDGEIETWGEQRVKVVLGSKTGTALL